MEQSSLGPAEGKCDLQSWRLQARGGVVFRAGCENEGEKEPRKGISEWTEPTLRASLLKVE